jgi:hypothetical protein
LQQHKNKGGEIMKRLINILLILAATCFIANSQVITFKPNVFYESYTGVAGDTAKSTTAKNFDIYVGKTFLYYYDVQVSADSAGDGTDFTVQLYGSNDNSNWYTVGSSQTWYVSETDTIMQFTNYPSSESWGVAEYAITTAAHAITKPERTDYVNGFIDSVDVDDWLVDDTITVAADTFNVAAQTHTVAAQTYTITKQYPVGWRYLRVTFTGGGASAKCEIELITAAIRRKD